MAKKPPGPKPSGKKAKIFSASIDQDLLARFDQHVYDRGEARSAILRKLIERQLSNEAGSTGPVQRAHEKENTGTATTDRRFHLNELQQETFRIIEGVLAQGDEDQRILLGLASSGCFIDPGKAFYMYERWTNGETIKELDIYTDAEVGPLFFQIYNQEFIQTFVAMEEARLKLISYNQYKVTPLTRMAIYMFFDTLDGRVYAGILARSGAFSRPCYLMTASPSEEVTSDPAGALSGADVALNAGNIESGIVEGSELPKSKWLFWRKITQK